MVDDLLVGLEVHQQLGIPTKLFCACPPLKSDELPYMFERKLRPSQSETGRLDPAAVFEYSKGKSNSYLWNPESSCLVEADEEPPHPMSREGLEAAGLVGLTLGSNLVDEVHVMRKIVIDGSNTAGFQRTAVVGLGGSFEVSGSRIGVQSVTLEEDAARILGEEGGARRFALDRLGVALVEVALDPVRGDPDFVGQVALHLGRMLRSTGMVARGLGTIRQDMNVSLSGGRVVEVKGVQKLNLLPKVVQYERKRQGMLNRVALMLKEKGITGVRCTTKDVTALFRGSGPRVFGQAGGEGGKVACLVVPGFGGILGWEPEPGVRLGKEIAEVARANSLGGVVHSDEFDRQGVTELEVSGLRKETGAKEEDAMVLVAGPSETVDRVVPLLADRISQAPFGVPAETRAATEAGETRFMRPRPGSQRMYPETDIPEILLGRGFRRELAGMLPATWTDQVDRLTKKYSLSRDMALKLFDSDGSQEFERLAARLHVEPSFVASVLVDLPPRLAREGVPEGGFTLPVLVDALEAVDSGMMAKEAVPQVLKSVGEGQATVAKAIAYLGLGVVNEEEAAIKVRKLVARESSMVSEKGDSAFSPLMGEAMKELRGKADGALVARLLREEIAKAKAASGRRSGNPD